MYGNMTVKSNCGMCHSGCRVFVRLDGAIITGIDGDPDGPFNRGALCPIGLASTPARSLMCKVYKVTEGE